MSLLASGSNSVKVWTFDGKICEQTASSSVAVEDILSVRWNHTNQVVAAGTSEGNIHLLQGATGHTLSTLSLRQQSLDVAAARSIAFSGNSRYLASAAGPVVHIWDLKRRSVKISLPGTSARQNVEAVCFTAEGQVAFGDASGCLRLWDINRSDGCEELRRKAGKIGALKCLDVSTIGNIAAGYSDGGFSLWDAAAYTSIVSNDSLHRGAILSLAMSPKNPRIVITTGDDGRINLVDLAAAGSAASSACIEVGERLMSLSFQENAIYSAVGTHSGSILLYDWRSISKPIVKIPAHSPFPVYSVVFQVTMRVCLPLSLFLFCVIIWYLLNVAPKIADFRARKY
jgi:WD40 repeat protein